MHRLSLDRTLESHIRALRAIEHDPRRDHASELRDLARRFEAVSNEIDGWIERGRLEDVAALIDASRVAVEALMMLARRNLHDLVLCEAPLRAWPRDGAAPERFCIPAPEAATARGLIALVRLAEAIIGRVDQGFPAWLDDLVDGTRQP